MSEQKTKNRHLLDTLVGDLVNIKERGDGASLLDLCLSGGQKTIRAVPLRYRLIALGFVRGLSPEEVNRRLCENGCAQLYARSYWEASLIYAFRVGLSYSEWKELEQECQTVRETISEKSGVFSSSAFTLEEIRSYVENNSLQESSISMTRHVTRSLEKKLFDLPSDNEKFKEFLTANLTLFSTVREKTRYYFCKYLLYFLQTRMEKYLDALEKASETGQSLSDINSGVSNPSEELNVFRVTAKLRRRKYTPAQARELIETSAVSLGEVYSAFDYYYFEYISRDWMDILLENYGDPDTLPAARKHRLADLIRHYRKSMNSYTDEEVIAWQKAELIRQEQEEDRRHVRGGKNTRQKESSASYQAGRAGENFLRKVLRGNLDLDRTTFLAFLLFFGDNADIPDAHKITRARLNTILGECGYGPLDESVPFDSFLCRYLTVSDPAVFLIEEAEELALSEENFYLYKTYLSSASYEAAWEKLL